MRPDHTTDDLNPAVPVVANDALDVFARELARNQPRLRGLIRCLLFDRQDVEDVWQDSNVTRLKKAADFRPGTNFWAWASQVTHHAAANTDRLCLDRAPGFTATELPTSSFSGRFVRHPDGRGYTLEYLIPWTTLGFADDPPQSGDTLATAWELRLSDETGRLWRNQIIEIRNQRGSTAECVGRKSDFRSGPPPRPPPFARSRPFKGPKKPVEWPHPTKPTCGLPGSVVFVSLVISSLLESARSRPAS